MILSACKSTLTLHFETSSQLQQRVRSGGKKTHYKGTLRTVSVDQYENFIFNPEQPVLSCVDIFLDGDKPYLYCRLVREIKIIQLVCYLYVCGCTDRSPMQVFVNECPLRMSNQRVTEIMREYMATFQVFLSLCVCVYY